ncbi:unnamed protein product [Caenorhabditis nigoni]
MKLAKKQMRMMSENNEGEEWEGHSCPINNPSKTGKEHQKDGQRRLYIPQIGRNYCQSEAVLVLLSNAEDGVPGGEIPAVSEEKITTSPPRHASHFQAIFAFFDDEIFVVEADENEKQAPSPYLNELDYVILGFSSQRVFTENYPSLDPLMVAHEKLWDALQPKRLRAVIDSSLEVIEL